MPRQARKKSESGIYHVMLRGINRQRIFEDQEDYEKFLRLLKEYKAISGYKLFAYCLMGNHIHLLIKIEDEPIEQVFKRIGSRFVYWYNIKYQRNGHLFQDRFKSEPVENDEYFLTVLRYIHQNPVKAKLCKKPEDYPYSSYEEFEKDNTLIDKTYVFEIIDPLELKKFHNVYDDAKCLEMDDQPAIRLTDEDASQVMNKVAKCRSVGEFSELDELLKIKYIQKMNEKGCSIRQICRLTGITKGIVEKWLKH